MNSNGQAGKTADAIDTVTVTINGKSLNVMPDLTLLEVCRKIGINIPTMCHLDGLDSFTSCMVCVVYDRRSNRMLPACSALPQEGMMIETDGEAVRAGRRAALELLLSDHLGDCEAPCQRTCPAHMDIPKMIREIGAGDFRSAIKTVREDIALPAVLGRICPAPCEKACRRRQIDEPVAICLLKRFAADQDLAGSANYAPVKGAPSGKRVAVVGAGPTGLAAAYYLLVKGHAVVIFEQSDKAGGALRSAVPEDRLPREVLDREIDCIRSLGAEFRFSAQAGRDITMIDLHREYGAVVLAVGPVTEEKAERFGVPMAGRGLEVNPQTLQSGLLPVFAGGGAVGVGRLAVRAVADGKRIAESVDQWLRLHKTSPTPARFNSMIGPIREEEKEAFLKQADPVPRQQPDTRPGAWFSVESAGTEAGRCLHCDCRKADACKLRDYAGFYEAKQAHFKPAERRLFEQLTTHPDVVFEQGKCIACGLCVRITEKRGEALGVSFVGRGITTRIGVPFGESLKAGLTAAARECIDSCPTGALAGRG